MKLKVVHLEGSKQGLTEEVAGDVITIGRDPSNTLSFDPFKDLDVSTRHASITLQNGQAMLQDLGSTNGTFLNGEKITGTVGLVHGGCIIQFGDNGPKLQISVDLSSGPGKKTRMIHDLQSEIEAAGLQAEEARKQKKRSGRIFVLLGFLGLAGFATFLGVSYVSKQNKLKEETSEAQTKADDERVAAEKNKASEVESAKEKWEAAEAAKAAGEEALEAEDYETATKKFAEARELYKDANSEARLYAATASLTERLKSESAEKDKARKAAEEQDADKQAELEAKRKKEKEEEQKRLLAKIKAELEKAREAGDLLANVSKLEGSGNPEAIKNGLSAIDEQLAKLKESGANEEEIKKLEEKKEALKKELKKAEEVALNPDKLKEIAKRAKGKVVEIRSEVVGIPGTQTLKTTNVRLEVTKGHGSGAIITKDGKILTGKEVLQPELFDPEALALRKKLEEKFQAKFFRKFTVRAHDAKKDKYVEILKTDWLPDGDGFTAGGDAWGEKQKVKIKFDNKDQEVEVAPHLRGSDAWAILTTGKELEPLEISSNEVFANLPAITLGVQKEKGEKTLALFMFDGKVSKGEKEGGKVLELNAPSLKTWVGGPIMDPNGKVIAILVQFSKSKNKDKAYESRASIARDLLEKLK